MAADDPGIAAKTGFAAVEAITGLKGRLAALVSTYNEIYTLMPHPEDTGFPHAKNWAEWLADAAPRASWHDIAPALGAMRQIKTPTEIALLTKAVDISIEAQLAGIRTAKPGLYEYQ